MKARLAMCWFAMMAPAVSVERDSRINAATASPISEVVSFLGTADIYFKGVIAGYCVRKQSDATPRRYVILANDGTAYLYRLKATEHSSAFITKEGFALEAFDSKRLDRSLVLDAIALIRTMTIGVEVPVGRQLNTQLPIIVTCYADSAGIERVANDEVSGIRALTRLLEFLEGNCPIEVVNVEFDAARVRKGK